MVLVVVVIVIDIFTVVFTVTVTMSMTTTIGTTVTVNMGRVFSTSPWPCATSPWSSCGAKGWLDEEHVAYKISGIEKGV